jgi:hypothetical protein
MHGPTSGFLCTARAPPFDLKLTYPFTEFFVARTYAFESQLSRPYSLGFAVPDPESEEEMALERRGSQTHPLVIDESDASEQSEDDEQAEVTLIMEEVLRQGK